MREIEFRGHDLDTKRWYYGSYARLERTSPYPMSHTPEEDNERHEREQVDHYIFFTEMNDWGLETKKLRVTVDRKSVGQYIGLKDKNGRKIYEGDVIHWGSANWFIQYGIKKGVTSAGYYAVSANKKETFCCFSDMMKGREVLGNTYENADLL
jgi:uncharacterized phage protein (TIGR01671 family)